MARKLQPLVFLGATAFPELSEIVRDVNTLSPTFQIEAILDDNQQLHGTQVEGIPVRGPLAMVDQYDHAQLVFGIGSYRSRLQRFDILRRLNVSSDRYATLVHPAAKVYSTAQVGRGCLIFHGAVVACGAVVEDFVQVLPNSLIGPNTRICEGALIAALSSASSRSLIGHYCHLGTGSHVGEAIKVGAGAQVAMGSIVVRDVPAGVFSFGDPPRFLQRVEVDAEILTRWEAAVVAHNDG